MTYRSLGIVWIGLSVAGCVAPPMPRLALPEMTLPQFDDFETGLRDTSIPTVPYRLSRRDVSEIKSRMSAAYRDERALGFGPISARQTQDGALIVCGFVDVPNLDGSSSGMRLFDGTASLASPGEELAFRPRRVAGRNAPELDVYSDCRDAGML